jgi:Holliday junction resolvase RusA-like endonuclease
MRLNITALGKPRMTQRDRWKGRPAVLKYHAYCDELNYALPRYTLPVTLVATFYLPMPASWSKKRRAEMVGKPHDQKPDIDNLAKGFIDAFKVEDKHVAILHVSKYWADEGGIELPL